MGTFGYTVRQMGAAATVLTEAVQLLQLYPVMPASVATAERSLSTLHRIMDLWIHI